MFVVDILLAVLVVHFLPESAVTILQVACAITVLRILPKVSQFVDVYLEYIETLSKESK